MSGDTSPAERVGATWTPIVPKGIMDVVILLHLTHESDHVFLTYFSDLFLLLYFFRELIVRVFQQVALIVGSRNGYRCKNWTDTLGTMFTFISVLIIIYQICICNYFHILYFYHLYLYFNYMSTFQY